MPPDLVTFDDLFARFSWRPMRGCPGRYLLADGPTFSAPEALFGDLGFSKARCAQVPDRVWVAAIVGGGIISYARANGTFVHTLGDAAGFARKLRALDLT